MHTLYFDFDSDFSSPKLKETEFQQFVKTYLSPNCFIIGSEKLINMLCTIDEGVVDSHTITYVGDFLGCKCYKSNKVDEKELIVFAKGGNITIAAKNITSNKSNKNAYTDFGFYQATNTNTSMGTTSTWGDISPTFLKDLQKWGLKKTAIVPKTNILTVEKKVNYHNKTSFNIPKNCYQCDIEIVLNGITIEWLCFDKFSHTDQPSELSLNEPPPLIHVIDGIINWDTGKVTLKWNGSPEKDPLFRVNYVTGE